MVANTLSRMAIVLTRERRALIAFVILAIGAAVWRLSTTASVTELASFTEHGVSVRIVLEKSVSGQMQLSSTFTPTNHDFHLYSKDLPRDGLQGMGRPTLLEIASGDGIRATGRPSANQPEVANDIP